MPTLHAEPRAPLPPQGGVCVPPHPACAPASLNGTWPEQAWLTALCTPLIPLLQAHGATPGSCGPLSLLVTRLMRQWGLRARTIHVYGYPSLIGVDTGDMSGEEIIDCSTGHYLSEVRLRRRWIVDASFRQFTPDAPPLLIYPARDLGCRQPGTDAQDWSLCWDEEDRPDSESLSGLGYTPPAEVTRAYRRVLRAGLLSMSSRRRRAEREEGSSRSCRAP